MGAWGAGSFENDVAMDWAGSVRSVEDVRAPLERLKASSAKLIDADLACEVVAAAETVAMLMGRRSADFPDDLQERLADAAEPGNLLYHLARSCLLKVMRRSELAELWQEAAEDSGVNEWNAAVTGLIDRLNPEIEVVPWKPEHLATKIAAPVGTCAYCDGPIMKEELFGITLYDTSNMRSICRGFWLHLKCLNSRMHHKHAIANMRFDPDNMPDLDKL